MLCLPNMYIYISQCIYGPSPKNSILGRFPFILCPPIIYIYIQLLAKSLKFSFKHAFVNDVSPNNIYIYIWPKSHKFNFGQILICAVSPLHVYLYIYQYIYGPSLQNSFWVDTHLCCVPPSFIYIHIYGPRLKILILGRFLSILGPPIIYIYIYMAQVSKD